MKKGCVKVLKIWIGNVGRRRMKKIRLEKGEKILIFKFVNIFILF